MRISIVTPLYNEEKHLRGFFKSLRRVKYPKNLIELVVVNDASTDSSLEIAKEHQKNSKFKIKIIDLPKNQGRIIAREQGAKSATHPLLLFLDPKCELLPNTLQEIKKRNYSPITINILQKKENIFDTFFYLIRKKVYGKYYGKKFDDIYINKDNFDNISKGAGAFLCKKTLFLSSQPKDKENKNASDDTALLWKIIKKHPILKSSKINCYYYTRSSFKLNLKHIFNRGPKFIDYYYTPSKKHFWLINLTFILSALIIYSIIKHNIFIEIFSTLLAIDLLLSIYIIERIKELPQVFLLFPLFLITFTLGLIKGILIKLLRRT